MLVNEIKKALLIGVGGTALAVEKSMEQIDRLVAKGKLSVEVEQPIQGHPRSQRSNRRCFRFWQRHLRYHERNGSWRWGCGWNRKYKKPILR